MFLSVGAVNLQTDVIGRTFGSNPGKEKERKKQKNKKKSRDVAMTDKVREHLSSTVTCFFSWDINFIFGNISCSQLQIKSVCCGNVQLA